MNHQSEALMKSNIIKYQQSNSKKQHLMNQISYASL